MFISSCFQAWKLRAGLVALLVAIALPACSLSKETMDREHANLDNLRLHEVQYVGTHNSYKLHPDSIMMQALVLADRAQSTPSVGEPSRAHSLAYGHLPLEIQLELGMRLFELDLRLSGAAPPINLQEHYAERYGIDVPPDGGALPDRFARNEIQVFHTEDDFRSSCYTLSDCLIAFRNWSRANPQHLPVVIYLEAKYETQCLSAAAVACVDEQKVEQPFDRLAWERIERNVRSMIGEQKVVRPADIRQPGKSLRQSIAFHGWPLISDLRGKFLFVVAAADDRAKEAYAEIKDPLFFTFRALDHPDASFVIEFDPFSPEVEKIIESGFIASTYADFRLKEARDNDPRKMVRLFEVGSQMISTDFPIRDPRFSDYRVIFKDGEYVRRSERMATDQ